MGTLRRKFGMVFQYAALFDSMNVVENIAFPLIERYNLSRDEIMERVRDLLRRLDLAQRRRHRAEDSARAVGRAAQARGPGARAHRPSRDPALRRADDRPRSGRDQERRRDDPAHRRRVRRDVGGDLARHGVDLPHRRPHLDAGRRARSSSAGTSEEVLVEPHPALREFVETSGAGGAASRAAGHEAKLGVGHRRRAGPRGRRAASATSSIRSTSERRVAKEGYHGLGAVPRRRRVCSRSRACRPPASPSGRSRSASSTRRRRSAQDHDPHRARHQAVRERGRGEEVGVAAGRVLPGDRSGHARAMRSTASAKQMRVLKDGDQIKNVIEPVDVRRHDGQRRDHCCRSCARS